jgi:hypothetical protein
MKWIENLEIRRDCIWYLIEPNSLMNYWSIECRQVVDEELPLMYDNTRFVSRAIFYVTPFHKFRDGEKSITHYLVKNGSLLGNPRNELVDIVNVSSDLKDAEEKAMKIAEEKARVFVHQNNGSNGIKTLWINRPILTCFDKSESQ